MNGEQGIFEFSYGKDEVSRTAIINHLIYKYNFKSYLEIGVRNPNSGNFNKIRIAEKIGVDPNPLVIQNNIIKSTSDNFFKNLDKDKKFDIIFIDGLHLEEYVTRDINNSLNHLNENGFILLHDCNPPTKFHQREEYEVNGKYPSWNGTVWKSIVKIRMNLDNLIINTVNTDWGIGIINRGNNKDSLKINDEINYESLEKNRKEWLNLISVSKFLNIY